jgi:hypothetical protein
MKKRQKSELADELRPEYDIHELLKGGVRGKYATRYRAGTNLILLEPDVAQEFDNDANAINQALRLVIQLKKLRSAKRTAGLKS